MTDEASVPPDDSTQILKVANRTDLYGLAHSIINHDREGKQVVISCIGVMCVNQGVKAVAVANGKTAPRGYVFMLIPYFHTEEVDSGVENTVMRFTVIRRQLI